MNIKYILVLISEVLYYSMFMYSCRKEGKFYRYLICFGLITIIGLFIGTDNLVSYLLVILMMIYGMKYIVGIKSTLYDILVILIMLFVKVMIETPIYMLGQDKYDIYELGVVSSICKLVLFNFGFFRKFLNLTYEKLKVMWYKNNFYIRYIFSVGAFVYCIVSCIFIIFYYL